MNFIKNLVHKTLIVFVIMKLTELVLDFSIHSVIIGDLILRPSGSVTSVLQVTC
jgi:hypothetical protein